MVDGPSPEHELVLRGRLEGQAPEIDPIVYLTECDPDTARPGDFIDVEIVGAARLRPGRPARVGRTFAGSRLRRCRSGRCRRLQEAGRFGLGGVALAPRASQASGVLLRSRLSRTAEGRRSRERGAEAAIPARRRLRGLPRA